MAKVTVEKISVQKPRLYHDSSSARMAARKAGIEMPEPQTPLAIDAQEETDIS